VESFVDADMIPLPYFDKPYVLIPAKKAEKGYVLLRETLKKTGRAGIARVVIRTREYLAAVVPQDDALMLLLLRYPQELVDTADYRLPEGGPSDYRISGKELEMAGQLIESMSGEWSPKDYKDEFRSRLEAVIRKKMKSKGALAEAEEAEYEAPEDTTTNVVDFMSLLRKSIAGNKRTPAKKRATKKTAKKAARKTAKKAAKKKQAARKSTRKAGARKTG
jgi:DNA end-binding protein Ku